MKQFVVFALIMLTTSTAIAAPPYEWSGRLGSTKALVGGREGSSKLYVCRAKFRGALHPGKVVKGKCNIGYGGKEYTVHPYQLLFMYQPKRWTTRVTPQSVVGGIERGRKLYVCRAAFKGGVHPGKLIRNKCNIGYGGKEYAISRYVVLEYIPTRKPTPTTPTTTPVAPTTPTTSTTTAVSQDHIKWEKRAHNVVAVKNKSRRRRICRVFHMNAWHPGYLKNATYCGFGYGGRAIQGKNYQFLTSAKPVFWSKSSTVNNVVGGVERGQKRFVCRAILANEWYVGKTVGGKCAIGYGSQEFMQKNFEYLQAAQGGKVVSTPTTTPTPTPKKVGWFNFAHRYPKSAVAGGGVGRTPYYVCRANYKGAWHPGKSFGSLCYIGYGGKEIKFGRFQLLHLTKRTYTYSGRPTAKSIVGGVERGNKLYVCRGYHKNGVHIGKYISGACNIGFGGREVRLKSFSILRKL